MSCGRCGLVSELLFGELCREPPVVFFLDTALKSPKFPAQIKLCGSCLETGAARRGAGSPEGPRLNLQVGGLVTVVGNPSLSRPLPADTVMAAERLKCFCPRCAALAPPSSQHTEPLGPQTQKQKNKKNNELVI